MRTLAQLTANAARAVSPAGTESVCGLAPITVQFSATPASSTRCGPDTRLSKVTLPLVPTGWLSVPSTVTV